MKFHPIFLAFSLSCLPVGAIEKSATVSGNGLALSLDGAVSGQKSIFFTTYDAENDFPLAENFGGSPFFGRESAPVLGGRVDHFFSDWAVFEGGNASQYGWLRLTLPAGDGNENRVPDILEVPLDGAASMIGTGEMEWPSVSSLNVTGSLTRPAGMAVGSYWLRLAGLTGSTIYTGAFRLTGWQGAFQYERGSDPDKDRFTLSLAYSRPDGTVTDYTGAGSMVVTSPDQVRIPSFNLNGPDDIVVPVRETVLTRDGNRYVGEMILDDGFVTTSWMDYRLHVWLITDSNDVDGDGVPDLSDEFIQPPVIDAGPVDAAVVKGAPAAFSVTVSSSSAVRYQWRFNGSPLIGATARSLEIPAAGPQHVGEYSVAVTNDGGTVVSAPARLILVTPPVITAQPVGPIVPVGASVEMSVTATGTEPFTYQWRRNGTDLTGANSRILSISEVAESDAGDYTVRVANVAGAVVSTVARLIVNVPPSISLQPLDITVAPGGDAMFRVEVTGTQPFTYQWRRDDQAIPGATNPELLLRNVTVEATGGYRVTIQNSAGKVVSRTARLVVALAPSIVRHPVGLEAEAGATVVLDAIVEGTPPLTFVWRKDGEALDAPDSPVLELGNITVADHGRYSLVVTNEAGSATSADAEVRVVQPLLAGQWTPSGFRLLLSGKTGLDYVIEFSPDLEIWSPLITFSNVNGPVEFTDPAVPDVEHRYYRARPL